VFPPTVDPDLLARLSDMRYSCARKTSDSANIGTTEAPEIVVPEGAVYAGFLEVLIQSPTPGASMIAYTLDGSMPSYQNGQRVPAGIRTYIHVCIFMHETDLCLRIRMANVCLQVFVHTYMCVYLCMRRIYAFASEWPTCACRYAYTHTCVYIYA
jgi:hypothetical protein